MTSVQLAIDDFDPLFVYDDYTIWATPNPQDNPTWWNASSQETGSTWNQGECTGLFGPRNGAGGGASSDPIYTRQRSGEQGLIAATYHYTTTPGAKVSLNFTGE